MNIKGGDNVQADKSSVRQDSNSLTQHFNTEHKPYTRNFSLAIHSAVVVAVLMGFGIVLWQLSNLDKRLEGNHGRHADVRKKIFTDITTAIETIVRQEASKSRFVELNDHTKLIKEMHEILNEVGYLTERHIQITEQLKALSESQEWQREYMIEMKRYHEVESLLSEN